jgi:hypothetical protein
MIEIKCLRDFMYAKGLTTQPPCFYCGLKATTIDHVKPHRLRGRSNEGNITPACLSCNKRKGPRTLEMFRAYLKRIAVAKDPKHSKVLFYGEGARDGDLKRLRLILTRATVQDGKLIVVAAAGMPFKERTEAQLARDAAYKEERREARWRGRFTFKGQRAIRDIRAKTGCSFLVIERFVLGMPTQSDRQLAAALRTLQLDVEELRALKPQS